MIALPTNRVSRRTAVTRIGFDGFVELFDFPASGVLRQNADGISPRRRTGQVIGHQIEHPLYDVSVFEDLLGQQHRKVQRSQPNDMGLMRFENQRLNRLIPPLLLVSLRKGQFCDCLLQN